MDTFKTEAIIKKNHLLEIENVPFENGEKVEVIVSPINKKKNSKYPLWGTLYKYDEPFEPAVPPEEWEVLDDSD